MTGHGRTHQSLWYDGIPEVLGEARDTRARGGIDAAVLMPTVSADGVSADDWIRTQHLLASSLCPLVGTGLSSRRAPESIWERWKW